MRTTRAIAAALFLRLAAAPALAFEPKSADVREGERIDDRHVVTVYALKVPKIVLPKGASSSHAGFAVNANALAKASITATYGR